MSQTYVSPVSGTDHPTDHLTNEPNRSEALRSSFSGTTAPSSPTPVNGQHWYDTTVHLLKLYLNSAWTTVATVLANTFTADQTITHAGSPRIIVTDTTTPVTAELQATDSQAEVGTTTNHPLVLETYGNPRVTVAANGDVQFTNGIATGGNSTYLKTKIMDIGDWDMDATTQIQVAHGLTAANIRSVRAMIRHDDSTVVFPIHYASETDGLASGWVTLNSTYIQLARRAGGAFDQITFNATSYNRGWIIIEYV